MTEPRFTNKEYLVNEQYRNSANLNARVRVHSLYSTNPQSWNNWLFDQLEIADETNLLEVGCGPGYLWQQNRGRIQTTVRATLTDLSPGMVVEIRRHLTNLPQVFTFAAVNVLDLPFPDNTFDIVLAMHMLYHVPDRPAALKEISRVLKPRGKLYASTLGSDNMKELRDLLAPHNKNAARSITFGAPGSETEGAFNLDHGGEELEAIFSTVERRLYPDSLRVTEAGPLVDYVLSMSLHPGMEDKRPGLTSLIQNALDSRGGIFNISKESGLFIAQK